ncbi:MAG: STELLO glycosyltransferase family protein [Pyrinomonadaceae bacterium]
MTTAIVVTSISEPNEGLRALARGCAQAGHTFIVIGDESSPADFQLANCCFYNLNAQFATGFRFAELCRQKHYARKNIGYLIAAQQAVETIVETDDDNIPTELFWQQRQPSISTGIIERGGWINVFRYFAESNIWPRGFPLDHLQSEPPSFESLPVGDVRCPIQQGLTDRDADVDAIYRLTIPSQHSFRKDREVALTTGSWCPFNSQNTTWWKEALPLMYLPAYCSFRMTDIWRSFVAQRIAWTNNWGVLFHGPTVVHERNDHDLLSDFRDEIPGYLHNAQICQALEALPLKSGVENIADNIRSCYEKLVSMNLVGQKEIELLDAWLSDLHDIRSSELSSLTVPKAT